MWRCPRERVRRPSARDGAAAVPQRFRAQGTQRRSPRRKTPTHGRAWAGSEWLPISGLNGQIQGNCRQPALPRTPLGASREVDGGCGINLSFVRVADNSGIGGIRAASTRCPSLPFNTLSSPIDIHPRIARRRVARVPQAGCVAFLLSSTPLARLSSSGGVDQLWRGALSVPEVRTGRRCRLLHTNGARPVVGIQ